MAKIGIIYLAQAPNGRVYIGQTQRSLAKRQIEHRYKAITGLKTWRASP